MVLRPQFLVCFSMILWNFVVQQEDILLGKVLTFVLLYGSLYSTYIWAGQSFTFIESLHLLTC